SVNGRIYGTPAVSGGRVFVPSSDGDTMNAFSLRGRKLWTVHTGAYVYSSPAVWGGRVFFGSHHGVPYCVSAAHGRGLWSLGGGAAFLYRKHQGRDIRGSSSVEFVKTEPKAAKEPVGVTWPMYGYDTARLRAPVGFKVHPPFRRAPAWTFRAQALLEFPPVIAYSRIYIVNNAGTVFALHQRNGKALWKYR